MPKVLPATRFGNPILREPSRELTASDISSEKIQTLIKDMYYTLEKKKYGVGLAAPQVGEPVAISVIDIKPTPNRPDLEEFSAVLINPKIVETFGRRTQLWEGCISAGSGNNTLFARVPRYKKVRLQWLDENGVEHDEIVDKFVAHVAQHETDHLNGILFVDKVKDTTSYMMADEYRKRIVARRSKHDK
jgi:peptide deformylase